MKGLKRTHFCGEVSQIGTEAVVCGFVQKVRNLGTLLFIDLRDRTGVVQLAFNETGEHQPRYEKRQRGTGGG